MAIHCGKYISNAESMKKISIGTRQSRGDLDTAEPFDKAQEIYSVRVVYSSVKEDRVIAIEWAALDTITRSR